MCLFLIWQAGWWFNNYCYYYVLLTATSIAPGPFTDGSSPFLVWQIGPTSYYWGITYGTEGSKDGRRILQNTKHWFKWSQAKFTLKLK